MQIYVYRVTGVSSLVQANPRPMLLPRDTGLKAKKIVYDAAEQAEQACYRNERNEIYIPTISVRAAMLNACIGRKIGKLAAKAVISGCVFPVEESAILLNQKTLKPITKYKIDSRRAVVQHQGIIRCRPMIENWCFDLPLEIDNEMIPNIAPVTDVLNLAGRICGLLELRPNRRGIYGRFKAELIS